MGDGPDNRNESQHIVMSGIPAQEHPSIVRVLVLHTLTRNAPGGTTALSSAVDQTSRAARTLKICIWLSLTGWIYGHNFPHFGKGLDRGMDLLGTPLVTAMLHLVHAIHKS